MPDDLFEDVKEAVGAYEARQGDETLSRQRASHWMRDPEFTASMAEIEYRAKSAISGAQTLAAVMLIGLLPLRKTVP